MYRAACDAPVGLDLTPTGTREANQTPRFTRSSSWRETVHAMHAIDTDAGRRREQVVPAPLHANSGHTARENGDVGGEPPDSTDSIIQLPRSRSFRHNLLVFANICANRPSTILHSLRSFVGGLCCCDLASYSPLKGRSNF